jgi:hypothetical protein
VTLKSGEGINDLPDFLEAQNSWECLLTLPFYFTKDVPGTDKSFVKKCCIPE